MGEVTIAVELTNSVFIHIPKTGGTWVTKFLLRSIKGAKDISPKFQEHPYGFCAQHQTPDMVNTDKKTFCFIRHPIAWYRSYWRYKRFGWDWADWHEMEKCKDTNLNKFVNNVMDKFPEGFYTTFLKKYLKGIDFVGRQECLRDDLAYILLENKEPWTDEYGLRELYLGGKENVSQYPKSDSVYEKETLLRLVNAEKWVIENFYDSSNNTNN